MFFYFQFGQVGQQDSPISMIGSLIRVWLRDPLVSWTQQTSQMEVDNSFERSNKYKIEYRKKIQIQNIVDVM